MEAIGHPPLKGHHTMKSAVFAAILLAGAASAPLMAQDTLTSTSGSNAGAVSGSQSGSISASDQTQGQAQQANNAGIGNSTSGSASGAEANSGSVSGSQSNGNEQGQSQGQSANNDQGQSQGQSANNAQGQALDNKNTNQLGAVNEQGVTVNQTWNASRPHQRTYVGTNTAVPLAASSSFSSDYCGGTASGGASAAPIGISIGGAKPTFDKSCQSLRRAEKFGMIAANFHNMGQTDAAMKAMAMMVWSVCTSDSTGTKADADTANACMLAGMLGSTASPPAKQAYTTPDPAVRTSEGGPTPEAATRDTRDSAAWEASPALDGKSIAVAASVVPPRP